MDSNSKIFIAGHRGLVGSAVCRNLKSNDYTNVLTRSRAELDLRIQKDVDEFFEAERPEYVFLAAAKVGGIGFNKAAPADFIRDNLQIQTNVIDAAYRNGCKKLLFLGSACIYPKMAQVPIKEEYLMTGPLEPTNDPKVLNIGTNREVSIKELSELVAKEVGYTGKILWDTTKPNGTPRRALDTSKMDSLGWKSNTSLEDGLKITVDWFLQNRSNYVRV